MTDVRNRPCHRRAYSVYATKSCKLPPHLTTPTPPKADITANIDNYDTKQCAHQGRWHKGHLHARPARIQWEGAHTKEQP